MLVEKVKDNVYSLLHIIQPGVANPKKASVDVKSLQPLDQTALNLMDYNNLRVQNPPLYLQSPRSLMPESRGLLLHRQRFPCPSVHSRPPCCPRNDHEGKERRSPPVPRVKSRSRPLSR